MLSIRITGHNEVAAFNIALEPQHMYFIETDSDPFAQRDYDWAINLAMIH